MSVVSSSYEKEMDGNDKPLQTKAAQKGTTKDFLYGMMGKVGTMKQ